MAWVSFMTGPGSLGASVVFAVGWSRQVILLARHGQCCAELVGFGGLVVHKEFATVCVLLQLGETGCMPCL